MVLVVQVEWMLDVKWFCKECFAWGCKLEVVKEREPISPQAQRRRGDASEDDVYRVKSGGKQWWLML